MIDPVDYLTPIFEKFNQTKTNGKGGNTMKKIKKESVKTTAIILLAGVLIVLVASFVAFNKGVQSEQRKQSEIKAKIDAVVAKTEQSKQ